MLTLHLHILVQPVESARGHLHLPAATMELINQLHCTYSLINACMGYHYCTYSLINACMGYHYCTYSLTNACMGYHYCTYSLINVILTPNTQNRFFPSYAGWISVISWIVTFIFRLKWRSCLDTGMFPDSDTIPFL